MVTEGGEGGGVESRRLHRPWPYRCILVNLARAPSLLAKGAPSRPADLWRDDVDAVVVPAGACGGAAVMSLHAGRALVVAVEENTCTLEVRAEALRMKGVVVL